MDYKSLTKPNEPAYFKYQRNILESEKFDVKNDGSDFTFNSLITHLSDFLNQSNVDDIILCVNHIASFLSDKNKNYDQILKETKFHELFTKIVNLQIEDARNALLFILIKLSETKDSEIINFLFSNQIIQYCFEPYTNNDQTVDLYLLNNILYSLTNIISTLQPQQIDEALKFIPFEQIFTVQTSDTQLMYVYTLNCIELYTKIVKHGKQILFPSQFCEFIQQSLCGFYNDSSSTMIQYIIDFYQIASKIEHIESFWPFLENEVYQQLVVSVFNSNNLLILLKYFNMVADVSDRLFGIIENSIEIDENEILSFLTVLLDDSEYLECCVSLLSEIEDYSLQSIVFKFLEVYLRKNPVILQDEDFLQTFPFIFNTISNGSFKEKCCAIKLINRIISIGTPENCEQLNEYRLFELLINGLETDDSELLRTILATIFIYISKFSFDQEKLHKYMMPFQTKDFYDTLADIKERAEPHILATCIKLEKLLNSLQQSDT
ncbi:hypothetical protein TRFO_22683 [Tritrichomonas foetus]|uniref:Uncharacterized protein n=1 Tax=Tritrichomonas foetus TaxID=1144522 RepID=A0A1J4KG64_9EUKA|nr:hypothetical protein TRFO_22683 [Tritrichomonas foetus]|eukprot:OHT08764.1 hypothetical protein TRFO_22683 [Tritrichomonas foetus]